MYEIVINKLRPDLASARPDVRLFQSTPEQLARDLLVQKGILQDSKPTVLLDQVTGSKPADEVQSVGNFSVDFKIKEAQQNNRFVSSMSNDMWQDFYGILTELKSKVDLLTGP
jgi:hypothetical protein